jgi:hypothetical protein
MLVTKVSYLFGEELKEMKEEMGGRDAGRVTGIDRVASGEACRNHSDDQDLFPDWVILLLN